ncbi:MAG: acyl-CoA thioesterase [Deltaproteobacteria bacterium]|nr:acyl-CoA thioesterase [Candidatus Anaeroferrophillacea bacterium]
MDSKTVSQSRVILAHLMQPQDANPAGNIHGGVIMKLIDNAAGVVGFRHARRNVVTASIDRIDFHAPVYVGNLVTFHAGLNYAGRTSMEIGVRVDTEDLLTGRVWHNASAYLTFVALDENGRPAEIPPLRAETPEEERRLHEATERARRRAAERQARRRGNDGL